jgi:hypothetical protein
MQQRALLQLEEQQQPAGEEAAGASSSGSALALGVQGSPIAGGGSPVGSQRSRQERSSPKGTLQQGGSTGGEVASSCPGTEDRAQPAEPRRRERQRHAAAPPPALLQPSPPPTPPPGAGSSSSPRRRPPSSSKLVLRKVLADAAALAAHEL